MAGSSAESLLGLLLVYCGIEFDVRLGGALVFPHHHYVAEELSRADEASFERPRTSGISRVACSSWSWRAMPSPKVLVNWRNVFESFRVSPIGACGACRFERPLTLFPVSAKSTKVDQMRQVVAVEKEVLRPRRICRALASVECKAIKGPRRIASEGLLISSWVCGVQE